MTRIAVIGGTGYAGRNIVAAAAAKGLEVVSYSRSLPETPVEGVDYRTGDVTDQAFLAQAFDGVDVLVSALSPRGALAEPGTLRGIERTLARLAESKAVRFGVVGGAGSLLVAEGGPMVADTESFPAAIKPEADEMASVLADLRAHEGELDWFFVSPAGGFGAFAPGEATGAYRVGGDVLLVDGNGESHISGADFGLAVADEIVNPTHRKARFTVAY
ncbi:NAD(P)-dependent oxidoreductase [Demequina zhanjiangensis]|uniref:NAD(P)H-binding protein n=1 Tax=Demequina zhanjiangensis TaxID=3051659 RepID=A0ABT8G4H7_9MICO|nr:NAD(P)H-binding protein [Demequina sp. SYSU T00b26]MDN4474046.1 NAD(P)H-binding protein [Demequina sp. SYSU T00b26]